MPIASPQDDRRSLHRDRLQIAGYFGGSFLIYYLCFPQGGFADIPIQYMLKDALKLDPEQMAWARLWIAAPTYVAFLFGFMRDRWSPFGKGDRGILWIFAPIAALSYGLLATGEPSYRRLLVGTVAATVAFRFMGAVTQGLSASVGTRRGMTGRLSTLWTIVWNVLAALSYVAGGWVSDHLTFQEVFALLGCLTMAYFAIGLWSPWAVFEGRDRPVDRETHALADFKRIVSYRPIRPAAMIWLLWSFAPGFSTALLFYLTNLKVTGTQFGLFNGIFALSFLPTFLLYGHLCQFVSLRKLLFFGTVVAIPQMVPLLFIKTPAQALILAVPIGLSGGVATAAYLDLLMRSCPKKLEGTGMMIADTGYFIAIRVGDLFGTWLFQRGGFGLTTWITTFVYALILPLLLLVPRSISSAHDVVAAAREGTPDRRPRPTQD